MVSSDSVVGEAIAKDLNDGEDSNRTIDNEHHITVLGVDFAAGRPVNYMRMKERLKMAMLKAAKINALSKGGWRTLNIMRAHVVSAVTYSARVNGVPNTVLEKLRTVVRTATSTRAKGGSATMDLMLQRPKFADPMYDATTLPVMEWVVRVNEAAYLGDEALLKNIGRHGTMALHGSSA